MNILFLDDERDIPTIAKMVMLNSPYHITIKNASGLDATGDYYSHGVMVAESAHIHLVRNMEDFVVALRRLKPDFISFDHDLGIGYHNGMDCAKEFCRLHDSSPFPFDYHVHSMNPIGKKNIISYIESYKKTIQK